MSVARLQDLRKEALEGGYVRFVDRHSELRSLLVSDSTKGGYLLGGEVMDEIVRVEGNVSVMRGICRVLDPIKGDELPVPTEEAAMSNAEWTSEIRGPAEDTRQSFGQRVLYPHLITKRMRVSNKLLRSSFGEKWVLESLGDAVASAEEKAFIQGSGAGEPWGLLNAEGLPVYHTASAGAVSGDDLRNWLFRLPARFASRARILTTVDFLRHVLTVKDASGQYLFPDYNGKLLGFPVILTDGMPAIVDASDNLIPGEYAAVVGDFKYYWIVDGQGALVQRLGELYAELNETAFQIRQWTDGMAVVPGAFYALQLS